MTPTTVIWLQLAGVLALEISLLAVTSALLDRLAQSATWRRTLWQACLIATIVLLTSELGGFARAFLPTTLKSVILKHGSPTPTRAETTSGALPQPRITAARQSEPAGMISTTHLSDNVQLPDFSLGPKQPTPMRMPATAESTTDIRSASGIAPSAMPRVPAAPSRNAGEMASVGFGLLWIMGFAAVLGRALFCRTLFVALRWKWPAVANTQLQERVHALARRIGMRRRVRMIESTRLRCPVAFGFVRPTIGLPGEFAGQFEGSEQDAILLHELAHLRAADPLWRVVAELATALLWWHPLTWWMRYRLDAASESAADEASLLLTNGPNVLAECLVRLGVQLARNKTGRMPVIAMIGFQSHLGRRVERLVQLNGRAWRAPSLPRSALTRLAAVLSLVLTAILCTAWAVPAALTKGENMQTMHHTWKRSLAAFGLLAALGTQNQAASAAQSNEPGSTPVTSAAGTTANWTRAAAAFDATLGGTANTQLAAARTSSTATLEDSNAPVDPVYVKQELEKAAENHSSRTGGSTFTPSNAKFPADLNSSSKEKQAVETKLRRLVIDHVSYDGVPLAEIVKNLGEISAQLDPEHVGINFLAKLDRQPSPPVGPGVIDPTTGLPVAAAPAEQVDLNTVTVRLQPPLRHVRLIDVLDAITKVADRPIKFSIEDYGVVFALDEAGFPERPVPVFPSAPLLAWTYKVDTNTFFAGLESAFGIHLPEAAKRRPQDIQEALRNLLVQLGISDAQNKSIFYNPLTGVLLLRATQEDLAIVTAAIQTLGGAEYPIGSTLASPVGSGR